MEIIDTGNHFYWSINLNDWKKVYDYGSVAVLENSKYRDRARLEDAEGYVIGRADIAKYSDSEVIINYSAPRDANLILSDTYTPGWKAELNSKEAAVEKYMGVFRQVSVPKGEGTVRFHYEPSMFNLGLTISALSFGAWILLVLFSVIFPKK
jgi:uncharacterized membrane protein YfhO